MYDIRCKFRPKIRHLDALESLGYMCERMTFFMKERAIACPISKDDLLKLLRLQYDLNFSLKFILLDSLS